MMVRCHEDTYLTRTVPRPLDDDLLASLYQQVDSLRQIVLRLCDDRDRILEALGLFGDEVTVTPTMDWNSYSSDFYNQ